MLQPLWEFRLATQQFYKGLQVRGVNGVDWGGGGGIHGQGCVAGCIALARRKARVSRAKERWERSMLEASGGHYLHLGDVPAAVRSCGTGSWGERAWQMIMRGAWCSRRAACIAATCRLMIHSRGTTTNVPGGQTQDSVYSARLSIQGRWDHPRGIAAGQCRML